MAQCRNLEEKLGYAIQTSYPVTIIALPPSFIYLFFSSAISFPYFYSLTFLFFIFRHFTSATPFLLM